MTESEARAITSDKIVFLSGGHDKPKKSAAKNPTAIPACYMEHEAIRYALKHGLDLVSTFTDKLDCACPVIRGMLIAYNDRCGDGDAANERRRRVLGPIFDADIVAGSKSTPEVEQQRRYLAADWSLRNATPRILRSAEFADAAGRLEALAPIIDAASLETGRVLANQIWSEARAKRSTAWARIRAAQDKIFAKKSAEAAAEAAVAVAVAEAEAAVAVAVAAAEAEAAAEAVAVAEAAAVAEGAAAAAVAVAVAVAVAEAAEAAVAVAVAAAPSWWKPIYEAAFAAKKAGRDYWAQRAAARAVARKLFAENGSPMRPKIFAVRDEIDVEFTALVSSMAAVKAA